MQQILYDESYIHQDDDLIRPMLLEMSMFCIKQGMHLLYVCILNVRNTLYGNSYDFFLPFFTLTQIGTSSMFVFTYKSITRRRFKGKGR